MKKLTYLFLAILIVACSSDDSSEQLFLEKYDSVVWEVEWGTSSNTIKIAFLNTSDIMIYDYEEELEAEVCFNHPIDGTWVDEANEATVTSSLQGQTEDSIFIKYDYGDTEIYNIEYRVTFDGEVYKLKEYGDGYNEYIRTDDGLCF